MHENKKALTARTLVALLPAMVIAGQTWASTSLVQINQQQLNQLADTLDVKYRLLSNMPEQCPGSTAEFCYHAQIEITSPFTAKVDGWKILYSQVYPATQSKSEQLTLRHFNGDLNHIAPSNAFTGFEAGKSQVIEFWVASSLLNEGELMPNYILTAQGLEPKVIKSTQSYIEQDTRLEIKPYAAVSAKTSVMQSHPDDQYANFTSAALFENYKIDDYLVDAVAHAIVPTPDAMKVFSGEAPLNLSRGIKLQLSGLEYGDVAAALKRLDALGVKQTYNGVAVNIIVRGKQQGHSGAYQLSTQGGKIQIEAQDSTGAFYGLQSVASLLSLDSMQVPAVSVVDKPRYDYRGLHLDVARNFRSKGFVLRLLSKMSAYKLNKLHFHLADDEGWRIEIPGLPELTALSSHRCIDLDDKHCLQPQLGSAINTDRDGYYSIADYQEILNFAKQHHIEIIPSLDMPGHSRAAVKAMEKRFYTLTKKGKHDAARQYLVSDPQDVTEYRSIQHYNDNTLNVCMESTYAFVDKVISEVAAQHKKAGSPLNIYHIGADETAGAWVESPACKKFIADKSNDVHEVEELTGYFIERVSAMIAKKGIEVAGWNDGLSETRQDKMPRKVASYVWATLPQNAHKVVSAHARRGWDIILSTPDVTYLDFPYELDPKESGYKWGARRTNSKTIFEFMPDNLPANAEVKKDTIGRNYVADDRTQVDENGQFTHQPLPEGFRVTGIQGHLWSEVVRKDHLAEYMLFPRLLALAEKAWHRAQWEVPYNYAGEKYDHTTGFLTAHMRAQRDQQWQDFIHAVGHKELEKFDRLGVFYRIPNVVSKVIDNRLHASTIIPGLPIQYRVNQGEWREYDQPLTLKAGAEVELRALSPDRRRPGRIEFADITGTARF
ncbi:carbohydate-binding domain-containing protein [Pseudoalteromonas luteoviolacea]|uniref:family 20 glycosylhydrolase n=1 Tax=Pseudoalteromonas luteoviolacea TaxID=43657 RepID=UPI001F1A3FF7|nr:family 20 glycosylhydrolase [Pseudoalteromonas luteoviolacea]MCF6442249.1 carbohydate-binding domain-containing protein [Pseudoalteromonas luteoviolacea]